MTTDQRNRSTRTAETNTDSSGNYNIASSYTAATSNNVQSMSWEGDVEIGDTFRVKVITGTAPNGYSTISASFTGNSDQILTAPETFSSDTASFTYANAATYTLSTLPNAPVGTYITSTYAASTNTITQTTGTNRPTQTDADMNTNGVRLFTRAYNAASTAGNPARIQIQIGKGLKGTSLELYKSTGKVTSGATTTTYVEGSIQYGPRMTSYDAVTGVLTLDAGYNATAITSHLFEFTDLSTQNNGYFVINASKNVSLTGIGLNRIATRAINTAGTSIANNTTTIVTYNSVKDFDTVGALNTSTGVYTATEAGYYQVNARIMFTAFAVAASVTCGIYKNGVQVQVQYTTGSTTANVYGAGVSDVLYLKKDDTVDVRVFQNTGTARALESGISGANVFSIAKISV